ncbi:S41 family peptidase [Enterococcus sp. LJL128]
MKKQRQVPYYQYIISIICTAIIVGGGSFILFRSVLQSYIVNQPSEEENLREVSQLYNSILEDYVGKVDKEELVEGALKGMMESLDDPYSSYLGKEESTALEEEVSGSFEGIGATLGLEDDILTVMQAPIEGSPAEKAGLKMEDQILKIDGDTTEGATLSESVSKIRGEKGSDVRLEISRGEATFELTITRDTIPLTTVSAALDETDKTIGNIRISSFGGKTFEELKTAVKDLRKEGAVSFIIDLRQNPGGLLDQVEKMSSMFLKDGQKIVQFEDKAGNIIESKASSELDGGFKVEEPVVVLVDGGSASASEIFAAALKESGKVKVIGTKTFGKGTVQTVKGVGQETSLKLSILKWLTPEGNWIHEKGLAPTIEADFPEYAYLAPISRSSILRQGDQSEIVANLNKMLKALDFDVDETADFNEKTKQAVESIQTDQALPVSGEVDETTAEQIEGLLKVKIQNNDGAYNTAIEQLQK